MSWYNELCSVHQLNYAKSLAEELDIDYRYEWIQQNFTKGELSNLIKKFRKQLGLD